MRSTLTGLQFGKLISPFAAAVDTFARCYFLTGFTGFIIYYTARIRDVSVVCELLLNC